MAYHLAWAYRYAITENMSVSTKIDYLENAVKCYDIALKWEFDGKKQRNHANELLQELIKQI